MPKKRKLIRMLVAVSVPRDMTAAEARREVRTLINEQCNFSADPEDIRARAIGPAPAANVVPLRPAPMSDDDARAAYAEARQLPAAEALQAASAIYGARRDAKAKAAPAPKAEKSEPIVADRRAFEALRARMSERFAAQRQAPRKSR